MTEQEYTAIAAACDRLLRGEGTTLARIAIPLLHLINEHPGCTSVYTQPALAAWEDAPRAALRAARALLRASRQKYAATTVGAIEVLIVSHLVNPAQLEQQDDHFFGPLQRLLTDMGITSRLVLVNHCGYQGLDGTVLPDHAPPAIEAHLWLQSLKARNALLKAARAAREAVDRKMATLASRQAWLAPSIANLRLHWQITEICKQHTPRMVLTTCAGDACERLIWHAARTSSARTFCVGYQHGGILQQAHAIRRPVGMNCDPDAILTSGDIPHTMLANSPGLATTRLIPYGSHRAMPERLREGAPPSNTCLVLPDAAPGEYAVLRQFAQECARLKPEITFKVRPHPATGKPTTPDLLANLTLSAGTTLAQDCATARYCLYRGSSAVIQAVMAGVRPFYVKQSNELPFDPIANLREWRETVTSPAEFAALVLTPGSAKERKNAASFCQHYMAPLRPEALTELLNLAKQ